MKKLICMLLSCMLLCLSAAAEPRLPQKGGAVVDDAAVLSQHTAEEITKLREILDKDTGVELTLVTVDFLDGYALDDYGRALLDAWNLGDDALLVLLAVGEDKCASFSGKDVKLSAALQRKVAAASLEPAFLAQDYDKALQTYFPALVTEIGKAYGERIDLDGLFGVYAARETVDWLDRLNESLSESSRRAEQQRTRREEETRREDDDDGISLGKIILTCLFLSMIFGGKKRRGCGCAPFAGLWGLFRLWDRD